MAENIIALLLESDDDDNISSSDSDDEVIEAIVHTLARTERTAIQNYSEITILNYNDDEFVTHFRVSKVVMDNLIDSFKDSPMFLQHLHDKTLFDRERNPLDATTVSEDITTTDTEGHSTVDITTGVAKRNTLHL
ncbi:hypothetical protein FQR65_LT19670 [Abscondita terminalis]|nr:hypothetical protein FQR65_LT19670 [Abscondita terminalis]